MAEFVYLVDEFATQYAGTLAANTIGRFATDVLYKFSPSLMAELSGGIARPQQSWVKLCLLILSHFWTHTLSVSSLNRLLVYQHGGGVSFKDFV